MNIVAYRIYRAFSLLKMFLSIYWNFFLFLMLVVKFGKRLRGHNKVYVLEKGYASIGDYFHFSIGDC